jgi:hypothetical protein
LESLTLIEETWCYDGEGAAKLKNVNSTVKGSQVDQNFNSLTVVGFGLGLQPSCRSSAAQAN